MAIREVLATVTSKGQVTLPVEVQRCLGLGPHDKVTFAIDTETNEVTLRPTAFTPQSVFGSVAPATSTEDFSRISREAWAEKLAREADRLPGY
jgi:bifunctional DNA-binding transcriptional regulator/antitoxin component of YhaV-PrlF toxin-antitoxin module